MNTRQPIVVCGAGIAGLALALGLARAGQAVTLLGPRPTLAAPQPDVHHPRVYAISTASQALLSTLGIWRLLDASRVTPVQSMQIHGDASGEVLLHAWQAARPELAWIIESGEIERALRQAVDVIGVPWVEAAFSRREPGEVVTDTGARLPAALVVGADGARSAVRTQAGIAHVSRPYGDTGLVIHLDAALPHQGMAMQWFLGDSILALLPMPDTANGPQVSMVWSMPQHAADALLSLSPDAQHAQLQARLAHASGGALGALRPRSRLLGFPLFLEHSDMMAEGVALVSDAAHRVHPLAGQGLNLGLGDVAALLQVIREKEAWRSAGDLRVLRRYRRLRAQPLLEMRLATDGLHRLFAAQTAPLVWARNAGMQLVQAVPWVKRILIDGAAGTQAGAQRK